MFVVVLVLVAAAIPIVDVDLFVAVIAAAVFPLLATPGVDVVGHPAGVGWGFLSSSVCSLPPLSKHCQGPYKTLLPLLLLLGRVMASNS